jgi:PAS domain-containing protein
MNQPSEPPRFADRVVADMPDAVVYADAEGTIRVWNRGAVRIFGFTEAEALGQSLDIIIPANLRERHWQGYRETMRTGRSDTPMASSCPCRPSARTARASRSSSPSFPSPTRRGG